MVSQRAESVSSFAVFDVLKQANDMDDVIKLNVGEPDFEPPHQVVDRAITSLREGGNEYTSSQGKPELREAISGYYDEKYGVDVDPDRIITTPGTTLALQVLFLALLDSGDDAVITDPYYSCYPNWIEVADGNAVTVPLDVENGFQPDVDRFARALEDEPEVLLLNSPGNPTGAVFADDELAEIVSLAEANGTTVISDEIYHGLTYDGEDHTLLEYTDDAFVTDGFSKRWAMTGWRLGWIVAPPAYVDVVERLAQNMFICAPSFVQDAGTVAVRQTDQLAELRATFQARRDYLVSAVDDWGLSLDYTPGGAYYLLIDVSDLPGDSFDAAQFFIQEAGVAMAPGIDTGELSKDYLRVSYANSMEDLREASDRIMTVLDRAERSMQ